MFCTKKLYMIEWKCGNTLLSHVTIIDGRDEVRAINKFYRKYRRQYPSVITIKEYKHVRSN